MGVQQPSLYLPPKPSSTCRIATDGDGPRGTCASSLAAAVVREIKTPAATASKLRFTTECLFIKAHGFSASSQMHTNWPQPGHPDPYFRCNASDRSTPATLAIVASHARTSAN